MELTATATTPPMMTPAPAAGMYTGMDALPRALTAAHQLAQETKEEEELRALLEFDEFVVELLASFSDDELEFHACDCGEDESDFAAAGIDTRTSNSNTGVTTATNAAPPVHFGLELSGTVAHGPYESPTSVTDHDGIFFARARHQMTHDGGHGGVFSASGREDASTSCQRHQEPFEIVAVESPGHVAPLVAVDGSEEEQENENGDAAVLTPPPAETSPVV